MHTTICLGFCFKILHFSLITSPPKKRKNKKTKKQKKTQGSKRDRTNRIGPELITVNAKQILRVNYKILSTLVYVWTFSIRKSFLTERFLSSVPQRRKSQCNLLGGKTSRQYMAKAALWGSWDGNTWI